MMKSNVTEVATDVYRISTFHPDYQIQINQYLVNDEQPFLMHTGLRKMFEITRDGVASVVDPSKIRWLGFSHFESDECGALNKWLGIAPRSEAVCGFVGAMVMVNDFADRPARALNDRDILEIGRHRLRFLATPHVPHGWDAGMFFEETTETLFCSDLFFHPGDPEPIIDSGIVARARDAIISAMATPLAKDLPYTPDTDQTLRSLAELKPRVLATMHGSSFRGDGQKALLELASVIKETLGA
jgi:flavorubredoxin